MYDSPGKSAVNTIPNGVYFRTNGGFDPPDSANITNHATLVAGIMIGDASVAPGALLHSASLGGSATDVEIALTLNRLATLGGGVVRATNLSFGVALGFFEEADGSSHLTQFVDWSARRHDVLYVAAWANEDADDPSKPTDHFNGITVAASQKPMGENVWRQFGETNGMNGLTFDDTQNIHMLAPGHEVFARGFDAESGMGNLIFEVAGTSFATPSVTGATALLHQLGSLQAQAGNNRFFGEWEQHEVMKAALMNSADKLAGVQGSTRTIIDSNDQNWTQSEAYNNPAIPLDDQLGAGHLNVGRAVQQFTPGEHEPGMVPLIGWDYSPIPFVGSTEYIFDQPLSANQYVSATLIWDRQVESTGGNTYNEGDQFFSSGFPNLNLQLMTTGGTVVASSTSTDMNLEHIFTNDIGAGNYKLVLNHVCCDGFEDGDYALAWWIGDVPGLAGDFNGNGTIDAADYTVWRDTLEAGTNDLFNDPTPGIVDENDFLYWRDHFGETMGSGAGSVALASVPEPASWGLVLVGVVAFAGTRRAK